MISRSPALGRRQSCRSSPSHPGSEVGLENTAIRVVFNGTAVEGESSAELLMISPVWCWWRSAAITRPRSRREHSRSSNLTGLVAALVLSADVAHSFPTTVASAPAAAAATPSNAAFIASSSGSSFLRRGGGGCSGLSNCASGRAAPAVAASNQRFEMRRHGADGAPRRGLRLATSSFGAGAGANTHEVLGATRPLVGTPTRRMAFKQQQVRGWAA